MDKCAITIYQLSGFPIFQSYRILIMKAFKAIVSGKVQGVWFRDSTRSEANKLNLVGWVRNLSDGTVEVCAEGNESELQKLVEWLYVGSPRSKVKNVDVEWRASTGEFSQFEMRF